MASSSSTPNSRASRCRRPLAPAGRSTSRNDATESTPPAPAPGAAAPGRVGPQPLGQRAAGGTSGARRASSVVPTQQRRWPDSNDEPHSSNTRCSSGSRMIRPAHTQQTHDHADADDDERPGRAACRRPPGRCRPTCRRAPCRAGTIEHEAAGEADAGLLGPRVLAALGVLDAVLGERGEAAVEVGAAELVGDEQRLAGGVGGRVGEPVLEHGEGAVEVGREQPLALGGLERRPQLDRAAPADLEQRLGDRPAERPGEDADLLDHPRPRLLGLAPRAAARRRRYDGDREAWRRTAPTATAGDDAAEDGVGERGRRARKSTATTARELRRAARRRGRPAPASRAARAVACAAPSARGAAPAARARPSSRSATAGAQRGATP